MNQTHQNYSDPNFKALIVGPIQSHKNIKTTKEFYNEMEESHKSSDHTFEFEPRATSRTESDFIVDIKMEADGAKVIDVSMNGLKLFLKIDILYIIQNFFTTNFPVYHPDAKDKPTFFEPDYGNYPRLETVLNLNDCLICFEQMIDVKTT